VIYDGPACNSGGDCIGGDCVGGYSEGGAIIESGDSGYESQERVIYDGPADGAPRIEENVPTPVDSTSNRRSPHQLASYSKEGSRSFENGLKLYRDGQLHEAAEQFEQATRAEPGNALYQYHQALAQFDAFGADAAADALQQAVAAERREPIANWGQRMERVQGQGRLWIEKARREAGLVK
jgi:hypothetical protein